MKKSVFFVLFLFVTIIFAHGQNSSPIDLVLLLDTSSTMSSSYENVNNYITGSFLNEFLRVGDTFHLIAFSSNPRLDVARRISGVGDVETIIGRMLLQYPVENGSNISSALTFAEQYITTLPSRPKKIVLVSTGASDTNNLVTASKQRLNSKNATLDFIQVTPGSPISNAPKSGRPAAANVTSSTTTTIRPAGSGTGATSAVTPSASAAPQTGAAAGTNATGAAASGTTQPAGTPARTPSTSTAAGTPSAGASSGTGATNAATPSASAAPQVSTSSGTNATGAAAPSTAQPAGTQAGTPSTSTGISPSGAPSTGASAGTNTATTPANTTPQAGSSATAETKNGQENDSFSGSNVNTVEQKPLVQPQGTSSTRDNYADRKDVKPSVSVAEKVRNMTESYSSSMPFILFIIIFVLLLLGLIIFLASRRLGSSPNRVMSEVASGGPNDNMKFVDHSKDLAQYASVQSRRSTPYEDRPLKTDSSRQPVINPSGPLLLNLFVEDQNTSIGKRNIHSLKSGYSLSVGGGTSDDYLIFLVPIPPHIGEIRRNGSSLSFIPRKPKYFPDIGSNEVKDCINKTIRVVSDKNYEMRFRFEMYEDPLIALNRMLMSVKVPG